MGVFLESFISSILPKNIFGKNVGSKTHTLTPSQIPPLSLNIVPSGGSGAHSGSRLDYVSGTASSSYMANNNGGSIAHNNIQPTRSTNFIIKF